MSQSVAKLLDQAIADTTLESLREGITALDNELIQLLKLRLQLAKRVGEVKSLTQGIQTKTYLRPAREARVIRQAMEANKDEYPPEAIYTIWRNIMASCVHIEQPLTLLPYMPEGEELALHLAEAYFGNFAHFEHKTTSQAIVSHIAENPTHVGIFPFRAKDWWQPLKDAAQHDIYIFACLPFVTPDLEPSGVAITTIDLEPTGEDHTWWIISVSEGTHPRDLENILSQHGHFIDVSGQDILVCYPGYRMDQQDPLRQQLLTGISAIESITPVGCHANIVTTK